MRLNLRHNFVRQLTLVAGEIAGESPGIIFCGIMSRAS